MKIASQDNYLYTTLCIEIQIREHFDNFLPDRRGNGYKTQIEENTYEVKLEMKGFTLGQST